MAGGGGEAFKRNICRQCDFYKAGEGAFIKTGAFITAFTEYSMAFLRLESGNQSQSTKLLSLQKNKCQEKWKESGRKCSILCKSRVLNVPSQPPV